jgi:hypothetical protein
LSLAMAWLASRANHMEHMGCILMVPALDMPVLQGILEHGACTSNRWHAEHIKACSKRWHSQHGIAVSPVPTALLSLPDT